MCNNYRLTNRSEHRANRALLQTDVLRLPDRQRQHVSPYLLTGSYQSTSNHHQGLMLQLPACTTTWPPTKATGTRSRLWFSSSRTPSSSRLRLLSPTKSDLGSFCLPFALPGGWSWYEKMNDWTLSIQADAADRLASGSSMIGSF